MDLESQIESLKEELGFLSRSYEEDVKVLYEQLAGSELERVDVPIGAGLDDILETIRIHWEKDVEKNRVEAGALLPAKKRGLENTLQDAKHWHDIELQNLGAVVSGLEAELREVRAEAEQQRQEHQHLLARGSQLQRDVASYHALLDREEGR